MPDWLFATHSKDTTQSMEAFNRTSLPISGLLADADRFYSCAVTKDHFMRTGFQRPTNFVSLNSFRSGPLIRKRYRWTALNLGIRSRYQRSGIAATWHFNKRPDYVQTGKHRSRGGQLITVGADWQSQPGPTKSDQDNDQDNPQALLVIRPTTQIGWQIKGLIFG